LQLHSFTIKFVIQSYLKDKIMNTPAISLKGLQKNYGPINAVKGINLTVNKGAFIALIGENGAGKTTILAMLMGLITPSSGSVTILGHTPGTKSVQQKIGVMLQRTELPSVLKVHELIQLFTSYYERPYDLTDLIKLTRLDDILDRKYQALSGGQQRRVQFAIALCGQPEILFLDEPTVGLDMNIRREFWQILSDLKKSGTTIILTSHYLDEIEALSDRLIILKSGEIIADDMTSNIKKRAQHKNITCSTNLDDIKLKAIPGVKAITKSGRLTTIATQQENQVLAELLSADPNLTDLSVYTSTLEDALTNVLTPAAKN
jgi:ABC-2 type transport system ATP-binding protein